MISIQSDSFVSSVDEGFGDVPCALRYAALLLLLFLPLPAACPCVRACICRVTLSAGVGSGGRRSRAEKIKRRWQGLKEGLVCETSALLFFDSSHSVGDDWSSIGCYTTAALDCVHVTWDNRYVV
jgi:hypothetical protein